MRTRTASLWVRRPLAAILPQTPRLRPPSVPHRHGPKTWRAVLPPPPSWAACPLLCMSGVAHWVGSVLVMTSGTTPSSPDRLPPLPGTETHPPEIVIHPPETALHPPHGQKCVPHPSRRWICQLYHHVHGRRHGHSCHRFPHCSNHPYSHSNSSTPLTNYLPLIKASEWRAHHRLIS